jgi:hypothetical protein
VSTLSAARITGAVIARAVIARTVIARTVIAGAVIAGAVIAGAVIARAVIARAVIARAVIGRSLHLNQVSRILRAIYFSGRILRQSIPLSLGKRASELRVFPCLNDLFFTEDISIPTRTEE